MLDATHTKIHKFTLTSGCTQNINFVSQSSAHWGFLLLLVQRYAVLQKHNKELWEDWNASNLQI